MSKTDLYKGQIVFDKKRTDPTDDLLVVINSDVGTVSELEPKTERLVRENDVNQEVGFTETTPMVKACYVQSGDDEIPSIGSRIYTFPETRLQPVESEDDKALEGYNPYQWALAQFLSKLVAATIDSEMLTYEELQVLCMEAGVQGEVISKASMWGAADAHTKS